MCRHLFDRCRAVLVLLVAGLVVLSLPAQDTEKKVPAPDKTALAKAEALIKDLYKQELAKAKDNPDAGKELAATLLKQGRDTQDDPPLRFAALSMARDLAAASGDFPGAMEAITEIAQGYDINTAGMKSLALAAAVKGAKDKETSQQLAETALEMLPEALAGDDYEAAQKLIDVATTAATQAKSVALIGRVKKAGEEVSRVQKEYERVKPFVTKLAKEADDAEANTQVGAYYCLFKGNWKKGLPLLTKGKDAALKALAQKDLANPKGAKAQIAVGDGWWQLSEKEKPPAEHRLQERAAFWYEQALPDLSGLARVRLEKRLEQVAARASPSDNIPPPPSNVPVGEIRKFTGHTQYVQRAVITKDSKRIFSVSADTTLRMWDVATGKELRLFQGHTGGVLGIALSPDGKTVLTGSYDNTIRLWEADSGKLLHNIPAVHGGVWCVKFAPDGKSFFSSGSDQVVRQWDTKGGQQIRQFAGSTAGTPGIACTPDGKYVVGACHDNKVRVWEVKTGQLVRTLSGHTSNLLGVDVSRDGKYILSGGSDSVMRLWELKTGKELRQFPGHSGQIFSTVFSPDGKRGLSIGSDSTVRLWDLKTGKEIHRFNAPAGGFSDAIFAAHGRYAVSCHNDNAVRLWGLPK
jgi:outer membrane protein assembly factor BamB